MKIDKKKYPSFDGLMFWITGTVLYFLMENVFLFDKGDISKFILFFFAYLILGIVGGLSSLAVYSLLASIFKRLDEERFQCSLYILVFLILVTSLNLNKTVLYDYQSSGLKDNILFLVIWIIIASLLYLFSGKIKEDTRRLFILSVTTFATFFLILLQADAWYFDLYAPELKPGWYVVVSLGMSLAYGCIFYFIAKKLSLVRSKGNNFSLRHIYAAAIAVVLILIHFAVSYKLTRLNNSPSPRDFGTTSYPKQRPNIILLIMDTARASHFKSYGYARNTTPKLEALPNITVYRKAWSTSSWTAPAHASLFTGLFSSRHGVVNSSTSYLDYRHTTLAELLNQAGYKTAGFVANYSLFRGKGFEQGFQHYFDVVSRGIQERLIVSLLRSVVPVEWIEPPRNHHLFSRAGEVNRAIFNWLAQNPRQPFFLFANYMDAHWPYLPPSPFDRQFQSFAYAMAVDNSKFDPVDLGEGGIEFSDSLLSFINSQYDGELAYLDDQLGRLFSKLKENGWYQNSLIIITSDHGESLGEHGYLLHGALLYEGLTRIPLFVKYPGNGESIDLGHSVQLIDLFPTILEAAGVPVPKLSDGQPMKSVNHEIILEHFGPRPEAEGRQSDIRRAIIVDGFKYIFEADGKHELYNIDADPAETDNLFAENKEIAQILNGRLIDFSTQLTPLFPEANYHSQTREEILRLKNLGYVK